MSLKIKDAQLFVHRYYDLIKLALLAILLALLGYSLIFYSNQESREENRSLQVIQAVQDETRAQSKDIKQQFRALCVVIIHTSGDEGLQQLDPSLEQRCKHLADRQQKAKQAKGESNASDSLERTSFKTQPTTSSAPKVSSNDTDSPQNVTRRDTDSPQAPPQEKEQSARVAHTPDAPDSSGAARDSTPEDTPRSPGQTEPSPGLSEALSKLLGAVRGLL